MVFSTYSFIFLFLPIAFLGYRLLSLLNNSAYGKLWLVGASFYFYAQGSGTFFFVFVSTVLFNYAIGTLIVRARQTDRKIVMRLLLAVGLIENVGLLGIYKYTNFMIKNINWATGSSFSLMNIILPLGISFFTFQLIAFLVDCYRGKVEQFSLVNYLVFISFFPQLIVGPIVHHSEIIPQLEQPKQRLFNRENFMLGVFLFALGCVKKVSLADPLTAFSQDFYNNIAAADMMTTWVGVFGYTLSYYFDLSGYADMAIGLGLMFNVKLPENFNSPYKARNFRDYWQRWHITLSRFLSDYVFRGVYKKGSGSFNFYYAVMVTFLVSGFWHGAGWTFVLWGIINGMFVCTSNFMYRNKMALPFWLAWSLTFAGVVACRILFVSASLSDSIAVVRKMFDFHSFAGLGFSGAAQEIVTWIAYHLYIVVLLLLSMIIAFFFKNSGQMMREFTPRFKFALAAALCLGLALSQMTDVSDFLYFQF